LFERRWAGVLLESALQRLREEFARGGKSVQFELYEPFLTSEAREGEYEALGAHLGMTAGAVAVAIHRFRGRYRQLVRMALAQTVVDVGQVEEEARALFS
jgi:RNA polymerase sigma-70 factor (ECF subfamily)